FQIRQINDLTIGGHCYYSFWLVWQRSSHIDGINITTYRIGSAIENFIERFNHTKWMSVRHLVNLSVLPTRNITSKFLLQFFNRGSECTANGLIPGTRAIRYNGISKPAIVTLMKQTDQQWFTAA